jgi:hypothetical protein
MSIAPSENPSWGFVQWGLTLLMTSLASAGAFLWRLVFRLEKIEADQTRHESDFETASEAGEAALRRLADRLAQIHDEHFRLRETIGALPNRSDLRDLEERLAQRLAALAARLDRVLDS